MTPSEALALLELEPGSSERQVRGQLFRRYQDLTTALAELDDERQRPLLENQVDRLNQARDVLLGQPQPDRRVLSLVSAEDLPQQVMVLLYQQGGQEGIHTIRQNDLDTVLAFENSFAARKFAQRLAQQGLPRPVVERLDTQELIEFCQAAGHDLHIVPANETLDPPEVATDRLQELAPEDHPS